MIKTLQDIRAAAEEYNSKVSKYEKHVLVCGGGSCISSNCRDVKDTVERLLKEKGLSDKIRLTVTGCAGLCALGPIVIVNPGRIFYVNVDAEKAADIVGEHLAGGKILEKYTYYDSKNGKHIPCADDIPFYKNQVKIALRHCGTVDFESLESALAAGGFEAAYKAIATMRPESVVEEIKKSNLRGRGGAGFPTGLKWEAGLKSRGEKKFIVCNADEGDPGAFMDRSLIEGDPFGLIEGMMIGGFAIGASKGYVYVRAEYPIAVERLESALEASRRAGLLGKDIFGTGFCFDIEIRIGAGAFVCGEETALMASIEGERGEPRQKPPFPFQKGLFGSPTIINNVETFANVPAIIQNGSDWFRSYGTGKSQGTKVFALAGSVVNTGIVEVPMGIKLRELIFDVGGGITGGKKFKAAQIGGPSGGCLTESSLDESIDYDNLIALGAMMGSGGLIVMDEDTCMVDTARFFLDFIQDESCGKCVPCRIGTKRMLEILTRITKGGGRPEDIEELQELSAVIRDTAMCGLGNTSPNPVLSTLRYFKNEYIEHIENKYCPAHVCKALLLYKIIDENCIGCGACTRACPVNAISGTLKKPHLIDTEKCIRCGTCVDKCKFGAIKIV